MVECEQLRLYGWKPQTMGKDV